MRTKTHGQKHEDKGEDKDTEMIKRIQSDSWRDEGGQGHADKDTPKRTQEQRPIVKSMLTNARTWTQGKGWRGYSSICREMKY